MYDENHWLLHETTVKFPNATVGDAIQVAQVELFRLFTKVLEQQNKFFIDSFNFEFDGSNVLRCKRLEEWRTKWEKIIDKDVSRICMYSYLFICVLMIEKYQHLRKEKVIMSSIHYASYVLILFTSTTSEFVRGLPMLQINGIVYVCVVLFKDLEFMDIQTREATIKLIFRTYWNLHKMGQKTNDAIATIANIICKLVELAQQNRKLSLLSVQEDDVSGLSNNTSNTASGKEKTRDFVGSGSVTNSVKYMGHDRKRRKSQQQTKLSYEDLPLNTSSVPRDNGTPLDLMQLLQTPNSSLPINVDDTQLEQFLSNLPETLPSLNTIFSPQG
ncbi:Uracil catabolism protein 2 [Pichia kudriavzevii]|uniref:Uracil catabolism protein 2 n=1 Tax=Pichia kudriavzevii TaxID=4909 RepID=A0A1V2LH72_PICKU|nr:Uracil catabolism protein 2 [Pichia kudriavzevii]